MRNSLKKRFMSSVLAVLLTNQMSVGAAFAKGTPQTNNDENDRGISSSEIIDNNENKMSESVEELVIRLYPIVKDYIDNNNLNYSEEKILEIVNSVAHFYANMYPVVKANSSDQDSGKQVYSDEQLKEMAMVAINFYPNFFTLFTESSPNNTLTNEQYNEVAKIVANFYANIYPNLKAIIEQQKNVVRDAPFFDTKEVNVATEEEMYDRDSVYIVEVNSVNNPEDSKYLITTKESISSTNKEEIKKQTTLNVEGTPLENNLDKTTSLFYESMTFKSIFKNGDNRSLDINYILGEYYDRGQRNQVFINSGFLSEEVLVTSDSYLPHSAINGVSNYIVQVNGEIKTQKRATIKEGKYILYEEDGYTFHAYSLDEAIAFGLDCVSDYIGDDNTVTTSQLTEIYNHLNNKNSITLKRK